MHHTNVFQKISCTPAHASACIFICICIFYFKTTKLSDPSNESNRFYTLNNDVLSYMNLPPSIVLNVLATNNEFADFFIKICEMLLSMFTFNYFRINTFTVDVEVIIKHEIFADSHLNH